MFRKTCFFAIVLLAACQHSDEEEKTSSEEVKEPSICNCDDLILDTGFNWFYLNDRLTPFNGTCTKEVNGVKLLEREYSKGKVNGQVKEWHQNGQLKLSMEFDNNLQVGNMKEWDEEGILEYHGIYSFGKMDSLVYKRQHLVTE